MVKRNSRPQRKRTRSEKRRAKKLQASGGRSQPDFVNASIRAAWDKRKTLQQNYAALGLAADPNSRQQQRRQAERLRGADLDATDEQLQLRMRRSGPAEGEERAGDRKDEEEGDEGGAQELTAAAAAVQAELSAMQRLAAVMAPYQVKSMSVAEKRRLQQLTAAHGDDVQAMARDIRINIMQDTAQRLSNRLRLYHRLQLPQQQS